MGSPKKVYPSAPPEFVIDIQTRQLLLLRSLTDAERARATTSPFWHRGLNPMPQSQLDPEALSPSLHKNILLVCTMPL